MTQPVVVAYTTAYPEAAGTLAPSISLSITDAIHSHFAASSASPSPAVSLVPCARVADVFAVLGQSAASVAVAPIESSEMGSFRSVYELIVNHGCVLVGEFAVASDIPAAASASAESAVPSTLWTRFVLASRTPAVLASAALSFGAGRGQLKCSAVLGLSHEAGSVFRVLSCFALRNLNVLKFEMRAATPSSFMSSRASPYVASVPPAAVSNGPRSAPTSPRGSSSSPFLSSHAPAAWSYVFYVDWTPSSDESVNAALLASLREFSVKMIPLGVYKANLHVADAHELLLAC